MTSQYKQKKNLNIEVDSITITNHSIDWKSIYSLHNFIDRKL